MNETKVIGKRKKRLGRGYGSGKGGHTVGKGQKGQKTRKRLGILFEGVKIKKSLIKRLPFMRGKSRFAAGVKPVILSVESLNKLSAGTKITVDLLISEKLVDAKDAKLRGVKILGKGKIEKKLEVNVPISRQAAQSVLEAGGKVSSNTRGAN